MPKPPHTKIATQVNPDPALEQRTRRSFTTEYKLKILAAADRCAHGELGALLRQERLYSNQLQQWRRDFAQGGVAGLAKTAPGPKPKFTTAEKALEKLRRENQRLTRELEIANGCLELQKKALAMRDHAMTGSDA